MEDVKFVLKGNKQEFDPSEVGAMVLGFLKESAEAFLGKKVKKAVITVPAYFNDMQRQATKDAGTIAGLEVVRIINEPTSAALAFNFGKPNVNKKIAVFDLGGGTFDISILDIHEQVTEVIATHGDARLGGDDFDNAIVNSILEKSKAQGIIINMKDAIVSYRVKQASREAKHMLSSAQTAQINLPFIDGQKSFSMNLTRAEFERIIESVVKRLEAPCLQCIKDAKLDLSEIKEVLLVGGMTRVPAVKKFVEKIFGRAPSETLNPDEVVAEGAAVQGAILAGVDSENITDLLLLDVVPMTFGIETLGGISTAIVEKNTTIPTKKTQTFSTAEDNQTTVTIHVVEGDRPMAKDNMSIGRFDLTGIEPKKRGVPQIEVTFEFDANGILNVSAVDKSNGKTASITITNANLSKEQVEEMHKRAAEFAEQDRLTKELAEAKNKLSSTAYSCSDYVTENKSKISAELVTEIESNVKKALEICGTSEGSISVISEMEKTLSELLTKASEEANKTN